MRQKQERSLSNHVSSRWYRPPEIILVEKNYNQQIDIWGIGCIIAELIRCSKPYQEHDEKWSKNKRYLFPGSSCFPLSPRKGSKDHGSSSRKLVSSRDQLKLILNMLGRQNEDDSSFITEPDVLDFHERLNSKDKKSDFKSIFPYSSDLMVDLLEGMLQYNPQFRRTAAECLQSKLFDEIRAPQYEKPSESKVE